MSKSAIINVWANSVSLNISAHDSLIPEVSLIDFLSIVFIIVLLLFLIFVLIIKWFAFLVLLSFGKIRLEILSSVEHQFFLTMGICTSIELTFSILFEPFAKYCLVVWRFCALVSLDFLRLCLPCRWILRLSWDYWLLNLGIVLLWKRLTLFLTLASRFLTLFLLFFNCFFIIFPMIFQILHRFYFFWIDFLLFTIRLLIWRITVIMIIRSECKYRIMHNWLLYTFCTSILFFLRLILLFILAFITRSAYILITWVNILINILLMYFLCNFRLNQFFLIFITYTTFFKFCFF